MRWELWFPARLGPPRKRTKTVNGVKLEVRVKVPELPPSANTRFGNLFAHQASVTRWRKVAKDTAKEQQLPSMARVRISAIVRRRALGTADEDNDRARLKPLVDGLRDAGVIAKDTRNHVQYGPCTEERAGADGPGVLLILEAIDGA